MLSLISVNRSAWSLWLAHYDTRIKRCWQHCCAITATYHMTQQWLCHLCRERERALLFTVTDFPCHYFAFSLKACRVKCVGIKMIVCGLLLRLRHYVFLFRPAGTASCLHLKGGLSYVYLLHGAESFFRS